MATEYNFTGKKAIIRGDTPTFNISIPDINIQNYTFRLTIKKTNDNDNNDTQAVLAKTWTTHQGNHNTSITLTKTDTAFDPDIYKYDVQISNETYVYTLIIGDWEHKEDTTKTS
jgi:hypothetical protein